ncbi:MAG: hypothetical protein JWO09_3868 [Bacteroidetes bacterium]|nr:hypothetical protein [Bacteroidota bacterium]
MKLDFVDEVNEYSDQVIRLYDFDKGEAERLRKAIQEHLVEKRISLDLSTLDFIEPVNCRLILHLAEEDEGILTMDNKLFFCDLTLEGYRNMVRLIEPYSLKNMRSFQALYDLDTHIDFLLAPFGS